MLHSTAIGPNMRRLSCTKCRPVQFSRGECCGHEAVNLSIWTDPGWSAPGGNFHGLQAAAAASAMRDAILTVCPSCSVKNRASWGSPCFDMHPAFPIINLSYRSTAVGESSMHARLNHGAHHARNMHKQWVDVTCESLR